MLVTTVSTVVPGETPPTTLNCFDWGISSVGRASGWQPEGQGFKSPILHQHSCHRNMFKKHRFRIKLPSPDPIATSRNFLISVNGRSSNRNIPIDQDYSDVSLGMGSFVFMRVTDRGKDGSMWVYEIDFTLVHGESVPTEGGFEVEKVD